MVAGQRIYQGGEMKSTKADIERMKELEGLYVGQLDKDETEMLNRCVSDNIAMRDYDNPAWMLGLAKVKVLNDERLD
jgi:hypothetical protein